MFARSTAGFDRLLEKATSQLLLEPDWTSNLMICDSIRQGDTNPTYAVTAIKKKFYHQNPHAALFALQVMESCVKNCGDLIHAEIATKSFMEELRDLVKQTTDDNIKSKVLELIQTWGTVFRNSPKYRIVTDTLHLMQAEGWKFPPVREAEAMFEADTAPAWAEGDVCHRCRVQFSTFTRQHHCRACGQVFCGKCSSKSCLLPKFGIEREVRVCDSCFDKYGPKEEDSPTHLGKGGPNSGIKEADLPEEYLASPLSKQPQEPVKSGKSEAELKEEEELQLVLALSKSEAEEKEKMKKKVTSDLLAGINNNKVTNGTKSPEESDPELSKYLNRDYWEAKKNADSSVRSQGGGGGGSSGVSQAKQAILANNESRTQERFQGTVPALTEKDRADDEELEDFTTNLRTQLEIFVNRMKSNSSRGRPISNDSSVQSLFVNMMTMHSKLVKYIQEQEDARVHYEGLQDKLSQVKDARAALDALREEERERKRREAEEAERQRQIQMAQKLGQMRKKKAEYLEYQRQMALKRMAEQEREMAMMQDASRQNYINQQQGIYSMYLPYTQHPFPGQPGMMPGQQGMMPGPGGMVPGQPGMMLGQHGGVPGQVGMVPGQGGMMPNQPGMGPGQPGAMMQPGMMMPGKEFPGQTQGQDQPSQDQGGQGQGQPGYQQQQQYFNPAVTTAPGFQDGAFNMQGMAGALPNLNPSQGQGFAPAPGVSMPHPGQAPAQAGQIMPQQHMPPTQANVPPMPAAGQGQPYAPPAAVNPDQGAAAPPPPADEATLISFD